MFGERCFGEMDRKEKAVDEIRRNPKKQLGESGEAAPT